MAGQDAHLANCSQGAASTFWLGTAQRAWRFLAVDTANFYWGSAPQLLPPQATARATDGTVGAAGLGNWAPTKGLGVGAASDGGPRTSLREQGAHLGQGQDGPAVGVVETSWPPPGVALLQPARVNRAIGELVERLSSRPFQKLEGSQLSLFNELDRPALTPPPGQRYECAEWKKATCSGVSSAVTR